MSYPNGAAAVIHTDLAVDRTFECKAGALIHFNGGTPVVAATTYVETYSTPARTIPAATYVDPTATITAVAPAGGTGAAAGGWDTAGHRDTAITTINELKTLAESLKTQIIALGADVLAHKKLIVALVQDLKLCGLIATS